MRLHRVIACLLAGLAMSACASIVGLEPSDCLDACDGGPAASDGSVAPGLDAATDAPTGIDAKPPVEGWTPVLLLDAAATCPAGAVGSPERVLANPKPSGPCKCICGAAPNACLDGKSRSLTVRTGSINCNDGTPNYTASATCFTMNVASNVNGASASPPIPAKLPCPATAAAPTTTSDATYKVCALPAGDAKACLMHAGAVACPAGFTKSMTVLTEAEASDPKGCGACTCSTAATSCTASKVTLYGQADCGGTSVGTLPVNGSCSAGSGTLAAVSAKFDSTPSPAGCTASPAPAMTLPPGRTICCAP